MTNLADLASHRPPRKSAPRPLESFWLSRPAHDLAQAVGHDLRCSVAIVGGGYSGLSAAYHLARLHPELNVALFEAGAIGFGASGFNSGQCAPRVGPPIERQVATLGEETAAQCYRHSLEAMRQTVELIGRERIDCDLVENGQLELALNGHQAALLERRADLYRRLGFEVGFLSGEALRRELPGAPAVTAALSFPAFALNPGRLCLGLKRALERAGVCLFERSRVEALELGAPARLRVNGHTVVAERVIVATDGYAPALGVFRRCVFPLRVFAAATRPLRREERDAVGWPAGQGLYDARHMFNFLRITAAGQIVIGGEYAYARPGTEPGGAESDRAGARLAANLALLFPALRDIGLVRRWSGTTGCTLDGWPLIAPLGGNGNAWHVGAWNGHGVALATASGGLLAALATRGAAAQEVRLPWLRPRAPRLPAAALVPWAVAAHVASMRARDAWEAKGVLPWRRPRSHRVSLLDGTAFTAEPEETLLAAALRAGLRAPHDCRVGACTACRCRLVSGRARSRIDRGYVLPAAEVASGGFLACQTLARSDLTLDWEMERAATARLTATLVALRPLTPRVWRVTLEAHGRLEALSGQYVDLSVAAEGGERLTRPFSLVAVEPGSTLLEIDVARRPGGGVSSRLTRDDAIGMKVGVEGPHGFCVAREDPAPLVAVGAGSGIGAAAGVVLHSHRGRPARPTVLLAYGARAEDIYALDEVERSAAAAGVAHTSRAWVEEGGAPAAQVRGGRAPAGLPEALAESGAGHDCQVLLFGPPGFVDCCLDALIGCGVAAERIRYDRYQPFHAKRSPASEQLRGEDQCSIM